MFKLRKNYGMISLILLIMMGCGQDKTVNSIHSFSLVVPQRNAVMIGDTLRIQPQVYGEGDFEFMLSPMPTNAQFDPESGYLVWAPQSTDNGQHTFRFEAHSGSISEVDEATVFVTSPLLESIEGNSFALTTDAFSETPYCEYWNEMLQKWARSYAHRQGAQWEFRCFSLNAEQPFSFFVGGIQNGKTVYWTDSDGLISGSPTEGGLMTVYFVDVEQGDSEFIIAPDGKKMLIDGGYGTNEPRWGQPGGENDGSWDGDGRPIIRNFLQNMGIEYIDWMVETHHHGDHYGGLDDVRNSDIDYGEYWSPRQNVHDLQIGDWVPFSDLVTTRVLAIDPDDANTNDQSIVLKMSYGEMDFVFTGDAEATTEAEQIEEFGDDLAAEVLKIGHHGSHTSSSSSYLAKVWQENIRLGIISAGYQNPYGHPHNLNRFAQADVFCTNAVPSSNYQNVLDDASTIKMVTDGYFLEVSLATTHFHVGDQ